MTATQDVIRRLPEARRLLKERIHEHVVGLEEVVDLVLEAILSGGHALLVGVPGLAKTLLVSTVANLLDLPFSRIQFTPDLMPSDIIGTEVIAEDDETGERIVRFLRGPVFCSVLLADEINRTPPKTQAALLEAMEEHQVTVGGRRFELEEPFFVLATQNPIEQEGTYPLPAAQLDRFTFMIQVNYPAHDEEYQIVRRTTAPSTARTGPILSRQEILDIIQTVRSREAPREIVAKATELARQTRPAEPSASEIVRRYVAWGVGPRGAQALVHTAKARALMRGDAAPTLDDLRSLAPHVFRHRMVLNFHGEAEGVSADEVLTDVLGRVLGAQPGAARRR